jgi:hypothetical protein
VKNEQNKILQKNQILNLDPIFVAAHHLGLQSSPGENMKKQSFKFLPKTAAGKWSVGLIIAMPVLFFIGTSLTNWLYAAVPAGATILADISARPALALTMLAGMAAGVSAFIIGLLAMLRQKDRAVLVFISTAIGALLLLFLAGEIISPH